jgi:hypothetical protein
MKRSVWLPSGSVSPSLRPRVAQRTPKPRALRAIESGDPTSSASGASAMKRSIPPFSSPSQCRRATYASRAGSSTSAIARRTPSYCSWVPVWINAGRSSSIRNWLKVRPVSGAQVEIR